MEDKGKPIEKMTVIELRDVAKELGAVGTSGMKKEELLTFIREAKGLPEERPKKAAGKKKVKGKVTYTVKELKKKIDDRKGKRAAALEQGDARMATIYKRQINRLKKRTRKLASTHATSPQ